MHVYYINLIGFVPASALFLFLYSDSAVHSLTNWQHVEHIGIGEVLVVLSIFDVMYLCILIVKLREREGQRIDLGKLLEGHL